MSDDSTSPIYGADGEPLPPPVDVRVVECTDLVVRVSDQLIVFPKTDSRDVQCIAEVNGRQCRRAVQEDSHGWSDWYVAELDGKVSALETTGPEGFIRQRCPAHVNAVGVDVRAPTWTPFSPARHGHLVHPSPRRTWATEGLRMVGRKTDRSAKPVGRESFADIIAEALAQRVDPPRVTALYRYFDAQGRLLYVGISEHLRTRTLAHVRASSWMDFAVRSTIERYPNRGEAEAAERSAIEAGLPLFNSVYNDDPAAIRRLVDYLIEHGRTDLLVAAVSRG